ncbi:MAG: hypothetical protein QGG40_16860, partial [Myxococcota bacterium]|nr:hypothetical protein [Myxococcota bacterium]
IRAILWLLAEVDSGQSLLDELSMAGETAEPAGEQASETAEPAGEQAGETAEPAGEQASESSATGDESGE